MRTLLVGGRRAEIQIHDVHLGAVPVVSGQSEFRRVGDAAAPALIPQEFLARGQFEDVLRGRVVAEQDAVRCDECDPVKRDALVLLDRILQFRTGGQVPAAGAVRPRRDQPLPIRRDDERGHFGRMAALQFPRDLAGLHVPQSDGPVAAGGEQIGAGNVDARTDGDCVRADLAEFATGRRVQAQRRRLAVSDRDGLSVPGKRQRREPRGSGFRQSGLRVSASQAMSAPGWSRLPTAATRILPSGEKTSDLTDGGRSGAAAFAGGSLAWVAGIPPARRRQQTTRSPVRFMTALTSSRA